MSFSEVSGKLNVRIPFKIFVSAVSIEESSSLPLTPSYNGIWKENKNSVLDKDNRVMLGENTSSLVVNETRD